MIQSATICRNQGCVSQCVVKFVVSDHQFILNGDFNTQVIDGCEMHLRVGPNRLSIPSIWSCIIFMYIENCDCELKLWKKKGREYLSPVLKMLFTQEFGRSSSQACLYVVKYILYYLYISGMEALQTAVAHWEQALEKLDLDVDVTDNRVVGHACTSRFYLHHIKFFP